ncbi:PLP-dependent aminotransferase family protein [Gloeocapsopsis dulcis]|uniref:Aspartate aminotransferase n=1 Tax=Gloeocapsopsis dulcis AAB1 = 1H9 TaxID=1433147 RepID=A0A6N8FVY1_9CHRO|nr:PLP-dependent aminotransferase family protein [Gloeocapsopsis dulcis]MUL37101.1 aspartate aminotransferase [Gloeocapsopsis dulcis AAB1 = 1H9]WNN88386.1 PLP-dependent aminotransferase family protein [Gloeocapsopsis dulcis]
MDLALKLETTSTIPLHKQLYDELRQAILSGRLESGQRMPSTRALAKMLGISRATVLFSYDQLLSEGYLKTIPASGTFVACQLPDELLRTTSPPISSASPSCIELSTYGATLATVNLPPPPGQKPLINFSCYGKPALNEFPIQTWRRLLSRACRFSTTILDYPADPLGYKPLREAIARYLTQSRAVRCEPDQVAIVNGSQQALDLIARLFLNRGDQVIMEDPGYFEARYIFQVQGAKVLPVPVDRSGLVMEHLSTLTTPVKLVYVTPSHQFPTGAVLSLPRRLALLAWAQQTGAIILEDDYDSEFRYDERPIPALQGLTSSDSVIYIGTFSKVMFPSLRMGYLVIPRQLVPVVARAKWLVDRQSPLLEQHALTNFINEGHLESHIRRMRILYAERRKTLVQALTQHLGNQVTIMGENAGMNVMVQFHTHWNDEEIIAQAEQQGVELISARSCYMKAEDGNGKFLLGCTDLTSEVIQEGVWRLAQILKA